MAYATNELGQGFTTNVPGVGSGLRIYPTVNQPKTFAAGSITLVKGAVVTYNTSTGFWAEFDADGTNGTNTIQGIVWPDDVVLDAGGEVIGQIMLQGRAHIADLVDGAQATPAEMATDLRNNGRDRGLIIEGLVGSH